MKERWRDPVDVLDIGLTQEVIQLPDGRLFRGVELVMMAQDIERIRLGYVCLNCLEPQEEAFPEKCSLCGYPMAQEQARTFERELTKASVQMGSRTTIERERERLREGEI